MRTAIHADRDVCIGAGMCVMAAPGIFAQDEEGLVVVRSDAVDDLAAAREAVDLCPSGALRLVELDG